MTMDIKATMAAFMTALQSRDWTALSATLSPQVRRCGPEGDRTDSVVGSKPYIEWLAGFADPLYEYGWHVHRIIYSDTGTTAVVDATTQYRIIESSTPFGYRLVMVFDIGEDGLIEQVDLYWKTPAKRAPGDTVTSEAGSRPLRPD